MNVMPVLFLFIGVSLAAVINRKELPNTSLPKKGSIFNAKVVNMRPVIGVVTQKVGKSLQKYGSEFFPSSYVKYIWQAGAMVVPVRVNKSEEYYRKLFSYTNGILFPGGSVSITTSGYAKVAQQFYKMAKKANDNGDYYPMWGTCLGFEQLSALTAGENVLRPCLAMDYSWPTKLTTEAKKSRLYADMPKELKNAIQAENITANYHLFCLLPKVIKLNKKLSAFYNVLSTGKDVLGKEFVSSIEGKDYPFYGTQFHPEKNNFIWNPKLSLNHSDHAVKLSQYFASFFVNEARKSNHKFPSIATQALEMINNFKPLFNQKTLDEYYIF